MRQLPIPTISRDRRAGLTLIEILIIVVIIGILVAQAIPRIVSSRRQQIRGLLKGQLQRVVDAQQKYYETNKRFAGSLSTLGVSPEEGVTITIGGSGLDSGTGWNATAVTAKSQKISCYYGHGADTVMSNLTVPADRMACRGPD